MTVPDALTPDSQTTTVAHMQTDKPIRTLRWNIESS